MGLLALLGGLVALGAIGCSTNDHPPCRRVSASEFMRPHRFKGLPTDRFIGITRPLNARDDEVGGKAFKEVWEIGWSHGWAVLWCPVEELPRSWLREAKERPYVERPVLESVAE